MDDPQKSGSASSDTKATERHKVLHEWNDTAADYPTDKTVHRLFEEQAERTPDAVAVAFEDEQLTYDELNRRANRLSHRLRKLGVGPEVLVGICVERSLEMVVGLLGILKAGGAYVPLDPAYPKERLSFMLEDAKASVLLTQERLLEDLPEHAPEAICLDTGWEEIARESGENPIGGAGVENLAYVIYTSGSTGKPKGVQIPHGTLTNFLCTMRWRPGLTGEDVLLAVTTLSFDIAALELFLPLTVGARVVMVSHETASDGDSLLERLTGSGTTVMQATPATWRLLLEAGWEGSDRLKVLCGGEALPKQLAGQVLQRCSSLWNMYGPTEATIWSTVHKVEPETDLAPGSGPVPIGRPIANTTAYVLDSHLRPVPVGVGGELHIGGEGLARGYLGRPELTAEKFIPDPFDGGPAARLYKTGDLARYRPDSSLEYLGRLDDQVKVRGFRIELGEIETVLDRHPAVRRAVVSAREGTPGDKQLVAYVVPGSQPRGLLTELKGYLQKKLPAYMVPSTFTLLDEVPLTPNGKVNRKALPAPDPAGFRAENAYAEPRTPVEEQLVEIWEEVLGLERVGVHDDFFELGGHSLLATRVVSRICAALGARLSLRDLFEGPTVAELAERIEEAGSETQYPQAPPIMPVPREDESPLSFAQQRMWFLDQLAPDSPLYNIPTAVRLSGLLDIAAMERSLGEIVRRHEALRTTFASGADGPVQVVAPALSLPLPLVDLRGLPEARQEAESRRVAFEEGRRPFDLSRGPLLRAGLLQLGQEEHVLLLTMHHIVTDGWSLGVFFEELAALYEAYSHGKPSLLPEPTVQYADYAIWQREWLRGEVLDEQLSYWKRQLNGAPASSGLPTDRPRRAVRSYGGAKRSMTLTEEQSETLRDFSQSEGVTLYMTLLAAFQTLLHRYSGQEDLAVGSPIAGRTQPETEGLIGFFVNTLVMRTNLTEDTTFRELLAQVREVALDAYSHQELPFERLVEELAPDRDPSRNPLFQVMFAFETVPPMPPRMDSLALRPLEADTETAKFDLTLSVEDTGQGLVAGFEYSTDLFDASTIERMAGHFRVLLEAIVADPDRRVSELPLLTEAERHRLLYEWNDTETDFPKDKTVHRLFEEQVERTPDSIALMFEGERLTYDDLNRRANRLAHRLRGLGVGPEVLVGICVERSLEMVVGLLGILKAGGAYVPLDPSYPEERLSFMLEDTRMPVVLTQERLIGILPEHGAAVVVLDSDQGMTVSEDEGNAVSGVTPDNLAYVIYTSGSTGKPKGVAVEHRNVVRLVKNTDYAEFGAEETFLQMAPISFDASTFEVWGSLLNGARLAIFPACTPSAQELRREIRRNNVTTLWLTAGLFHQVVEHDVRALDGIKQLLAGGDVLSERHVRQVLTELPGCRLTNGYGPTENTTFACCYALEEESLRNAGSVPIGRPIANTRAYVLDGDLRPVPVGVAGELHIGGDGVARGYLDRPELTAEKFIPDPFSDESGARLYKTGDLARYLPDGNIEFLGRIDHQVKIRGFRIELGEVEVTLSQHTGVRDRVVVAREDSPGEKHLVAYVVPERKHTLVIGELRDHLKKKVPVYMVPSSFVVLDALPLTPNGKVDRRALPDPDPARPELEEGYVAPRTPTEEAVARFWAEVLGIERVGVHDDFFELGGHSLLATRIVHRLRDAFQVELPLRDLFEGPTVSDISLALISHEAKPGQTEKIALLLERIESMSSDDVRASLGKSDTQGGGAS